MSPAKRLLKDLIWRSAEILIVPLLRAYYWVWNLGLAWTARRLARYLWWKAVLHHLGTTTDICPCVVIRSPDKVSIGSHCSINEFVHIWGGGGVRIGNDVLIAAGSLITSQTHDPQGERYRDKDVLASVEIGNNVWIGSNAVILPGVRVGDGAIIGAGAVVTQNVAAHTIVVGVPARELKMAGKPTQALV